MKMHRLAWIGLGAIALATTACDNGGGGGTDAGPMGDASTCNPRMCTPFAVPALTAPMPPATPPTCPTTGVPDPEQQMGNCCYRESQADQLAAPEMRIRNIELLAPVGSPLTTPIIGSVLNTALENETFNWLVRGEGFDADGDVMLRTGFGTRDDATNTYAFDTTGTWPAAMIPATLTGERLQSEVFDGSITVPVLVDCAMRPTPPCDPMAVQVELTLRDLQIVDAYMGENRSCIGYRSGARYTQGGVLTAFIAVEDAREGMIEVPPLTTTVCSAIAGGLSDPNYCAGPQECWSVQPDSLCGADGCEQNTDCGSNVCDPAGTSTTLPACNAWFLVGRFSAVGIDITD